MVQGEIKEIFRRGSKTYFYNSIFFPEPAREDVFILYSFVRKADNFVDSIPQRKEEFCRFREDFCSALDGEKTGDVVLDSFAALARRRGFELKWTEAFLDSMEMDLTKGVYQTIDETINYIYGSAEVIGLMMSKILGIDESYYPQARSLGKSMQYINFIRDIDEDIRLGRNYFPREEMKRFGLESLEYDHVSGRRDGFLKFMDSQIKRYRGWQDDAETAFKAIPRRYRIPVQNASDMYNWTAEKIARDPFIVYRRKVKPSKVRIVANLLGKKIAMKS